MSKTKYRRKKPSKSSRSRKNRRKRKKARRGGFSKQTGGCFTKSRGHAEVEHVLRDMGYSVLNEYTVGKRTYDMYVPEFDLLVEFNGTRWHYDPRFYEGEQYDRHKNRYVKEKWKKDREKLRSARNLGYRVRVIWQHDWQKTKKRHKFLKRLIRGVIEEIYEPN